MNDNTINLIDNTINLIDNFKELCKPKQVNNKGNTALFYAFTNILNTKYFYSVFHKYFF